MGIDAEVLWQVAEATAEDAGPGDHVGAVEPDLPGRRPGDGGGDPHQRRLAGAVGPEQAHHPGFEVQGDPGDRPFAAPVDLRDVDQLEHRAALRQTGGSDCVWHI
jgi:hypothetical protein